jgi:hypothetical protein
MWSKFVFYGQKTVSLRRYIKNKSNHYGKRNKKSTALAGGKIED